MSAAPARFGPSRRAGACEVTKLCELRHVMFRLHGRAHHGHVLAETLNKMNAVVWGELC